MYCFLQQQKSHFIFSLVSEVTQLHIVLDSGLLFWSMLKRSADLAEPQTHLPFDADTKVMKAFHGTLLVFGEAQPKPKLWPFAAVDCSLFL